MVKNKILITIDPVVESNAKALTKNFSKLVEDLLVEYVVMNKDKQQEDRILRKLKQKISKFNLDIAKKEQQKTDLEDELIIMQREGKHTAEHIKERREEIEKSKRDNEGEDKC